MRGGVAEPVREKAAGETPLTRFHQRLLAEELALKGGRATDRLASALSEARVDLNPHQVEAAAFALESLPRGGCMLADEVGLGKTIEAGIVLAQLVAEGKTNKEIASEVFLSDKTVKNYVSSILSKLNLERRAQAAAFVAKHRIGQGG